MFYNTIATLRDLFTFKSLTRNLVYVRDYEHEPARTAYQNPIGYANHQETLLRSFESYLFTYEIEQIVSEHRRSEATLEAILTDFFANDVEFHVIPEDVHTEIGLECMYEAFKPPNPCRPVHLIDIQYHYPFKWQVNSEPPFSTDKYFLDQLPTFQEYIDMHGYKHIDRDDFFRRYGESMNKEDFLKTKVPPKFGFQKAQIFSWVRRWHHVIKSGFTDLAGLEEDQEYIAQQFIFPMLLHTKTAIVKKDDPDKMRTIWGVSKVDIIAEAMLWWEYIAWVKSNPGKTPMLWGYETFTGGWFRLNAALFSGYMKKSFVTLDWSRFDKKAYFSWIVRIFEKTRLFLTFEEGYCPTVQYPEYPDWDAKKAQRLENLFRWTLLYMFTALIALPDGRLFQRQFAGIPSGMFLTQLVDSWYNYTMIATVLSAMGLNPKHCIIKVQGDDSIVRLGVLIPPESHDVFLLTFAKIADHYFKSTVSTEKSEMGNSLNNREVLSYRNRNGLPYRDEIKMLAQFYHTKARNPTPEITMAQAIGFAYASCGNHQRVLYALEDVYNYYKDQGYNANRAGLTAIFGNSPDLPDFPFDLDHFPTVLEIKQFFTCTEYINEVSRQKTWPREHFLFPAGERN